MAGHEVQMDDSYARWLASAPDSPVIAVLDDAADKVLFEAQLMAPVSLTGSKYAKPGFLRDRIVKSGVTHDDEGDLMVLVGTRTNRRGGANPYPLAFIDNAAGFTRNRGHKTVRSAHDDFLRRALDAAAGA